MNMTTKQIIGIIFLIGGVGILLYGLSLQNSLQYQFVSAFSGNTPNATAMMIGGGIGGVIGLILLLTGGSKSGETK